MNEITLTERAARRIGEILAGEPAGAMLRISVNGGGCSGFSYGFDIDKARAEDDLLVERDGAGVLVDETSLQYLKGSVVDFVDDLIGQSFRIENPQATSSCGCGTSFSL
jgi:iron-sulfur cluster assembly accessory protein